MRGVLPVLLLLSVTTACADMAPPPAVPLMQLHVGFPPGAVADTIRIDAVESLPLRAAVLVAPDGASTPASSLDVTRSPQVAVGQFSAGDPLQSALFTGSAATASFVPTHTQTTAAMQSEEQLLATVSTADIPLPDPVAYRRDWAHYQLRLTFGTPPTGETREIPAPQPPPGS